MIRLPAKTVRAISAGRTTQLRVLPGERRQVKRKDADRRQSSATRWAEPWAPRVGAEEALRSIETDEAGEHETARILITAKRRDLLRNLTLADVKAMGYGNIDNAKVAWVVRHDAALIARQNRTHLTPKNLELVLAYEGLRGILVQRFDDRWSDVTTWVIDVKPAVAQSRVLAAAGKGTIDAAGNGDYTTVPAHALDREAGGVIDSGTQIRYSKTADQHAQEFYRDLEQAREEQRASKRNPRVMMFRNAA